MGKGKIYFVRHGESEANIKGTFAGQKKDSPLTKKGKEQAKKAAKDLKSKNITIHKIISSPLIRAHHTAEIIVESLDKKVDIHVDERIIEYDMGAISGTPIRKVTSHELVSAKGAEDPNSFMERVHNLIHELIEKEENVLLVSHAGVGRIIEAKKKGVKPHSFYSLNPHPNAQVVELEV